MFHPRQPPCARTVDWHSAVIPSATTVSNNRLDFIFDDTSFGIADNVRFSGGSFYTIAVALLGQATAIFTRTAMVRRPVIAIIGSGKDLEPAVSNARELGRLIAENGWVLITGGRDAGVMRAANEGAKEVTPSVTI